MKSLLTVDIQSMEINNFNIEQRSHLTTHLNIVLRRSTNKDNDCIYNYSFCLKNHSMKGSKVPIPLKQNTNTSNYGVFYPKTQQKRRRRSSNIIHVRIRPLDNSSIINKKPPSYHSSSKSIVCLQNSHSSPTTQATQLLDNTVFQKKNNKPWSRRCIVFSLVIFFLVIIILTVAILVPLLIKTKEMKSGKIFLSRYLFICRK